MTTREVHEAKMIERAFDELLEGQEIRRLTCQPQPFWIFDKGWRAGYDEGVKWRDNKKQIAALRLKEMLDLQGKRGLPGFEELIGVLRLVEGGAETSAVEEASKPQDEREAFERACIEAGFNKPERSTLSDDQYMYERDQDRFVGWQLRASQPSASGREPLVDEALAKVQELGTIGAMKWLAAALTGAAPADANVGDVSHPLSGLHINQGSFDAAADAYEAEYLKAKHQAEINKLVQFVINTRESAANLCFDAYRKSEPRIDALHEVGVSIQLLPLPYEYLQSTQQATPTAPEVSAPADKEHSIVDTLAAAGQAQEKYHELIMAVGKKYPGETRHETALRYIRQAEEGNSGAAIDRMRSEDEQGGKL